MSTRPRRRHGARLLLIALLSLASTTTAVLTARPAMAETVPSAIVRIATEELNNDERNRERGGANCNFYSGDVDITTGAPYCNGAERWRAQAWCADFAKWVWQHAGVQHTGGINSLAASFKTYGQNRGTWHTGNPKAGDAITFDWTDANPDIDHVGLVTSVSATHVTFISGNSGNGVTSRETYALSDSSIVGYASPVYPTTPAVPVSRVSAALEHGNQFSVLGLAPNGHIYARTYTEGDDWTPAWGDLGGNFVSEPVAVVHGNRLVVAARKSTGAVWVRIHTPGSGWGGWLNRGGNVSHFAMGVYGDQLQFVGIAPNGGNAYNQVYDPNTGWGSWINIGGGFTGGISLVQYGTQLSIVGRANNRSFMLKNYSPGQNGQGGAWSPWYPLNGAFDSLPSLAVYNDQLSVTGVGTNGNVYNNVYSRDGGWSGWRNLGGDVLGNVSSTQYLGQFTIVARAANTSVYVNTFTPGAGNGWSGWNSLGGTLSNDPVVATFNNQVSVVARNTAGTSYINTFTPNHSWTGWNNLGGTLRP